MPGGICLIAAYSDDRPFGGKRAHKKHCAADDLFAVFQQQAVIDGGVRLAFGAVDDQGIRFTQRIPDAPGNGDTCFGSQRRDLPAGHFFRICRVLQRRRGRIQKIIFNDDGQDRVSSGGGARFHGGNGAGYGSVHSRARSDRTGNWLSHKDVISRDGGGSAACPVGQFQRKNDIFWRTLRRGNGGAACGTLPPVEPDAAV